ncbi:MAG: hypothetical protein KAS32_01165 [Candidatus Peribacteraceae bacterium]|nr:hypothetical protein [Candidatus Peribacteraceae bacterium]
MKEKEFKCNHCEDRGYTKELCRTCSGSGEGSYDGSSCYKCVGVGYELVKCEYCNITLEDWRE